MLDLIILITLAVGFIIGAKRGFIMQVMHIVSLVIALFIAFLVYQPLAELFEFFIPYPGLNDAAQAVIDIQNVDVDRTFYRLIAFAVVFFIVKWVMQIITSVFDYLSYLPVLNSFNRILGALLGILEIYIALYIILTIGALLPIEFLQARMHNSLLTGLMLDYTPLVTQVLQRLWFVYF